MVAEGRQLEIGCRLVWKRIVYCSRAKVPTDSLLVIAQILSVSQRNNDRDGLTGALAISDGWFLQVIEGQTQAFDAWIRRLRADPRHKDFEILSREPVSARLFEEWSMTSARITPELGPDLVALIDHCRTAPRDAVAALARIVALRRDDERVAVG